MAQKRKALLSLRTSELLSRFGAGTPTPGSGCHAALTALVSAQAICSIAHMTLAKRTEREIIETVKLTLSIVQSRIIPRLIALFELDATTFDKVIQIRRLKIAATDLKQKAR